MPRGLRVLPSGGVGAIQVGPENRSGAKAIPGLDCIEVAGLAAEFSSIIIGL